MPSKAEERAKEIQKRAKQIADRAADVKEIEAQATVIELRAREIENEVLARTLHSPTRNGNVRDFSNKEVYLLLLDEVNRKVDVLSDSLEKQIKWGQEVFDKYVPMANKQSETLAHICEELPDKGFCGKVDKMYSDMYPEKEEPLPDKVKILWYDRSIMKWVLVTSIGALIIGSITLVFGFIKGVF